MKIIFIAGPFRGDGSKEAKEKNIEVARRFVHLFIENNVPYYSPHLNIDKEVTYLGIDKSELAWNLNGELLLRCDALAVLPGWETSNGTKTEIENATKRNIPIFYLDKREVIQEIIDWIK